MIDISVLVLMISRGQDMGCSQKLMSTHDTGHDLLGFLMHSCETKAGG